MKKRQTYQKLTSTVLAGAAAFTSSSIDLDTYNDTITGFPYTKIAVHAYASHASATNGLVIEVSDDNTTFVPGARASVSATTPAILEAAIVARYFRVVYTNGATLQTSFILNVSIL